MVFSLLSFKNLTNAFFNIIPVVIPFNIVGLLLIFLKGCMTSAPPSINIHPPADPKSRISCKQRANMIHLLVITSVYKSVPQIRPYFMLSHHTRGRLFITQSYGLTTTTHHSLVRPFITARKGNLYGSCLYIQWCLFIVDLNL